ncbi:flagellar motor switch protein FliM [Tepidibacter thalassicus]|uniref:Flagellar motor switch protein FliM n=1 Tax=Tepidibacter thalassicus DSM 15285 TaxID=1123350 RepID=A0A1M5NTF7_9FIRM|nr:flagellar motor switch protein FliM [Tepidibacter thalassicus]SHG92812.1 flagellar motor switch protein FliM [Tepidibacter thalassicus DSM 15285]
MSEILSQSEIDALLEALNTGDVDVQEIKEETKEKKIKKYDFKSPKKLAKDQLRTLHIIHENYSRILNTFLSGYLRSYIQIEVLSVEELSYYEFSNSISNPAMLSIVDFNPLPGQMIMEVSTSLAFCIIDRILGGNGNYQGEIRSFTEIELTILNKIVRQIIKLLIEPWENVIELSPKLDKIETNSQFAQIVSPNETVALITLKAKISEVEGLINICIPHIVLEPILPKLSTKFWFSTNTNKTITDEEKNMLQKRLKKANIELSAIIANTTITVEEFLNLQVGDVISLNKNINEQLEIKVGNKIKFLGTPGSMKNKYAIKITKVFEKGDEEYDE